MPLLWRFKSSRMLNAWGWLETSRTHDDVIKWKHFPCYWPFVRWIHRSQVNSPHKGQWRGALMFSLICDWTNGWVNNRDSGDLRHHLDHYDVTVIIHQQLPRDELQTRFGHTQRLQWQLGPCRPGSHYCYWYCKWYRILLLIMVVRIMSFWYNPVWPLKTHRSKEVT